MIVCVFCNMRLDNKGVWFPLKHLFGRCKKRVINLGLSKNESIEEYNKAMDALTEESLRLWDEEDKK